MVSQLTLSLQHTVLGVSYLHPFVVDILGLGGRSLPLDPAGLFLAEGDVSLCSCLLEPSLAIWTLDIVRVGGRGLGRRKRSTCMGQNHYLRASAGHRHVRIVSIWLELKVKAFVCDIHKCVLK